MSEKLFFFCLLLNIYQKKTIFKEISVLSDFFLTNNFIYFKTGLMCMCVSENICPINCILHLVLRIFPCIASFIHLPVHCIFPLCLQLSSIRFSKIFQFSYLRVRGSLMHVCPNKILSFSASDRKQHYNYITPTPDSERT